MNKEMKAKWIEALRSGKYKQGKSQLHDSENNTYCCLGVLCDISKMGYWDDNLYTIVEDNKHGETLTKKDMTLPKILVDKYDLDGECVDVSKEIWHKGKVYEDLTSLNDNGFSFEEIADIIEEQF